MLSQSRSGGSTPPPPPRNVPPVANAGADQSITLPASSANLIGSGTDQDGIIASFNWTQVSGPTTASMSNAWGASNTVGGLVAGTYVFRLKVTDNAGATATDDINVNVNAAAVSTSAPVAVAGSDQSLTLPTNTAYLAGSGSYVPNGGTISNYSWSQVSGPSQSNISTVSTTNVAAANLVAGTYTYRLTVSNSAGSSSADMHVTVNGTGTPPPPPPSGGPAPVAVAGSDQTLTLAHQHNISCRKWFICSKWRNNFQLFMVTSKRTKPGNDGNNIQHECSGQQYDCRNLYIPVDSNWSWRKQYFRYEG